MPPSRPSTPDQRFRLVELVRLFIEGRKGHPLYGLAALVIMIALPVLIWRL